MEPTKTKPTISVLAEETKKEFAESTKTKPTISVLAEETGKAFAEGTKEDMIFPISRSAQGRNMMRWRDVSITLLLVWDLIELFLKNYF